MCFLKSSPHKDSRLTVPFQLSSSICFPGNKTCILTALPASHGRKPTPACRFPPHASQGSVLCGPELGRGLGQAVHLKSSFPSLSLLPRSRRFFFYVPFNVMVVISVLQVPPSENCLFSFSQNFWFLSKAMGVLAAEFLPGPDSVWNQQVSGGSIASPNHAQETGDSSGGVLRGSVQG